MQRLGPKLLLSATDLVNCHECGHLTALDLRALDDKALKARKTKPDEHTELLFQKGNEGADFIYQATFLDGDLVGHADFLRKASPSRTTGTWCCRATRCN